MLYLNKRKIVDSDIIIFPNPTSDYINLKFPTSDNYNIIIYGNTGNEIDNINVKEIDKFSIDMSSFDTGVYFILVKNLTQLQYKTYKVVKK